jgi:hypothetical protein
LRAVILYKNVNNIVAGVLGIGKTSNHLTPINGNPFDELSTMYVDKLIQRMRIYDCCRWILGR